MVARGQHALEAEGPVTFDEFWATTGPWPDNILGSAFKELALKAWNAGYDAGQDGGCPHDDCDRCDTGAEALACGRDCDKPYCGEPCVNPEGHDGYHSCR